MNIFLELALSELEVGNPHKAHSHLDNFLRENFHNDATVEFRRAQLAFNWIDLGQPLKAKSALQGAQDKTPLDDLHEFLTEVRTDLEQAMEKGKA